MKNHMFLKTPVESLVLAGHITFNAQASVEIPLPLSFSLMVLVRVELRCSLI